MTRRWSTADIGDLSGKTAVVTGPTLGGLGYHTALELARAGAQVVLAGRSWPKLDESERAIRQAVPGATLEQVALDLSDLQSVRAGAAAISDIGPLDLLVNNAGVMATPEKRTVDGFELQTATNHLGPFLLTGLLLPALVETGDARVVTVSSSLHRMARRPPDLDGSSGRRYHPWTAYAESKLANLLFTFDLHRRLRVADLPVRALAAHPGVAGTQLVGNGVGVRWGRIGGIAQRATSLVAQSAEAGAWPTLMAATADLPGGTYCGPGRLGGASGPPKPVSSSRLSHDTDLQRSLWEKSSEATGIAYP